MGAYDDILYLPHHRSDKRPPMSLRDRAAQFAPFAALRGYGAAIDETARRTEERIELDEQEARLLDERLRLLSRHLPEAPEVSITYFCPDERKSGGAYRALTGRVQRMDMPSRTLLLSDGTRIPFDDILTLTGTLF